MHWPSLSFLHTIVVGYCVQLLSSENQFHRRIDLDRYEICSGYVWLKCLLLWFITVFSILNSGLNLFVLQCTYINGSPQNTFVPGVLDLAKQRGVFVGGDDFKSGQTKIKSVLVDFLISAGLKPASIVSYNHLGNNDGKNLSFPLTFRSKEISKSNVVDDMVESNPILYQSGEKPDHCIVIKYIPYVGDSKR